MVSDPGIQPRTLIGRLGMNFLPRSLVFAKHHNEACRQTAGDNEHETLKLIPSDIILKKI